MHPYGFEEIVPKGCSKASGIDFIVKHLKASLDDCYVFGDSTNDLSMLTHVKNSIAMGNAILKCLETPPMLQPRLTGMESGIALKSF